MKIAGVYSFKGGKEIIHAEYRTELDEIERVIAAVDSRQHRTKVSKEKTMRGKMLYKPSSLNAAFKKEFEALAWTKHKMRCEYPTQYYVAGV